jgi:agmatine deiminase
MEDETPHSLGFAMPAEWAPHEGTWLSWPKNELTFPKDVIRTVEDSYCDIISALTVHEKVHLLVDDEKMEEHVRRKVEDANLIFHRIKSADVWIRDYGPTFLKDREGDEIAAIKWRYNAYGGKYEDLAYDDITGENIVSSLDMPIFRPGIVMEGGSIDVDGKGTLLTTEQCLLNKNRNPELSRVQIEKYLHEYVGAKKIIWLKSGIEGDDTDGHVDDFARFCENGSVLCAFNPDGSAEAEVLRRNLAILESSTDASGKTFDVVKLPMPKPLIAEDGRKLPASYANFYVANNTVLLPVFNDPKDSEAEEIVQDAFPSREIVRIDARDLVFGYGGIHCVSQQQVC